MPAGCWFKLDLQATVKQTTSEEYSRVIGWESI